MFRFEDPLYLYLLALLPLLWLLHLYAHRRQRRQLKEFGDPSLTATLTENVSPARKNIKFWLIMAAVALLIIMLARPQLGSRISNESRQGIEAIIAMDISNSMMAKDVAPSRLEKSKMLVENMVDHFSDDKVGLIVFAGDAFVQLPITTDYVSAKMFMQNISPSLIATQGTDIAAAIRLAINSFTLDDTAGKAIILITDGEDHEGGATQAAAEAKDRGINVFILGVGSPQGAPVPTADGGYITDNSGETVMSRLNEQMCREIAEEGAGTYIHVDNTSQAQEKLDQEIAKLQKGEINSVVYSEYDEQYQAVGLIVLLLLIIEACLLERKSKLFRRIKIFK